MIVSPSYISGFFYVLMNQYREQYFNISMGNTSVGSEDLPISWGHLISKMKSKAADKVDDHHVHEFIDSCSVACWV